MNCEKISADMSTRKNGIAKPKSNSANSYLTLSIFYNIK